MHQDSLIPDPTLTPPEILFFDSIIAGVTPMVKHMPYDEIISRPQGMQGYIINLTIEGEGLVKDGELSFVCKKGDMLLFPPHVPHYYQRNPTSANWYHLWIYFFPRSYWLPALSFNTALSVIFQDKLTSSTLATSNLSASDFPTSTLATSTMSNSSSLSAALATSAQSNASNLSASLTTSTMSNSSSMSASTLSSPAVFTVSSDKKIEEWDHNIEKWDHYSGQVGYFHVPDELFTEFKTLFIEVIERYRSKHNASQILVYSFIEQILFRRLELTQQPEELKASDPRVTRACLYIQEHLSSPSLTVNEIAANVNLSPSRIAHLFEQTMGTSIIKWRDRERFKLSCLLLVNSNLKIEQIAIKSGFNDTAYFFKFFKHYSGVTPSQYRSHHTNQSKSNSVNAN